MKINLTKAELIVVHKLLKINHRDDILDILKNHPQDQQIIEIDEDTADEIRDFASEYQQEVGFDKDYELTKEGKILEVLVDKFFIG